MFQRIKRAIASCSRFDFHMLERLEPRRLLAGAGVFVAAGDLDGDGLADLVTVTDNGKGSDTLTTYKSVGDGKSVRRMSVDLTPEEFIAIAVGDVNGDGFPDVVALGRAKSAAGTVNRVDVYSGDGKGGIAIDESGVPKPAQYFLDPQNSPRGLAVGDLDGDGAADIVVLENITKGRADSNLDVLWGSHPGQKAPTEFAVIRQRFDHNPCDFVAAGDVDGDGRADIIATSSIFVSASQNTLFTVSSLGDRKGLDSVQSNPLYEQSGSQGTNPLYEPKNARTIAVGDLNGDGRDELIGLDIRTDGTPATVSCQQLEKAWPVRYEGPRFNAEEGVVPRSAVTVSVGDINGDGADDLIVAPNKSGDPWFFGISAKQADGHTKLVWSPRSNIDL